MARQRKICLSLSSILFLAQTCHTQAVNIERQSSDPDPTISSGTCYYGAGLEADSSYIPCGNTAYGNFHCCEVTANCLDNNACFADGTTYVAGCTDPTYQDESCPYKGFYSDSQYSGLVYCNGTSNEWTLCPPANTDQVVYVSGCYCPEDDDSRNFAFSAAGNIPSQASLPVSNGGTMSLFPGYTPGTVLVSTNSAAPSSTQSSSPPSSTSSPSTTSSLAPSTQSISSASTSSSHMSSASITIPTSSRASNSDGAVAGTAEATTTPLPGLSTGEKAGIGIGATLGVLTILAALGCLAIRHRRRQRQPILDEDDASTSYPEVQSGEQIDSAPPTQYSPAWPSEKSELAGESTTTTSALTPESAQLSWSRPLSEAQGSTPTYQSMPSTQSQELSDTSVARLPNEPYRRAEVPPVGVQRIPQSSTASHSSYRPGRQVGSGVYEMPAQLPGSTLM